MLKNVRGSVVLAALAVLLCPLVSAQSHAEEAPGVKHVSEDRLPALAKAFEANLITGQSSDGKRFATLRRKAAESFSTLEALGLREQDLIRQVNGAPVGSKEGLLALVKNAKPGDLTFTVERAGTSRTCTVHVDGAPGQNAGKQPGSSKDETMVVKEDALEKAWGDQDPWLLLVMAAPEMVSDTQGNVAGVRSQAFGDIAVTRMLGLQNGDIIQSVNGYPVNSEQAIFDIVNRLEGERNFTAKLLRGGRLITLKYRIE